MLDIINSYFNDVKRAEDGFYTGYIDTEELYKRFLDDLKEAGFYFSVRHSENCKEGKFLFKCNKSSVPVPFSGSPFRREKSIMYECAYGSHYFGKKSDSSESDQGMCEKKRLRIRHSKKLGCKAKMAVKCIKIYLDYKLASDNAHWRLRKEVISTLKRDLMSGNLEVKSLSRYFVKISEAEQHCHIPMHPKSTMRKKLRIAYQNILRLDEISSANECAAVDETNSLDETEVDMQGEISLETISNKAVKEESPNLREQCWKKNEEIMNLSYFCHDEEQLKELLIELTKVTEKLNDNVSQSAETICDESEAPQVVEEEICLSDDISEAVVIDKDVCLEIEERKPVVVDKEICLEIDKDIYLDSKTHRLLILKKDLKRLHKENKEPCVRTLQSKRTQKNVPINQVKVIEKQKKALSPNLLEVPSNIEILQSNGDDDVILFIY